LILPYFLDPEGKVVVQVSLLGVNEIAIRLLLIIEPNQVHVSRRAGLRTETKIESHSAFERPSIRSHDEEPCHESLAHQLAL
jgi:hypothetical protein